jgi:hypothetical protein
VSHAAIRATDASFAAALAGSARGPDREGVFALWLVVRAALGAVPPAGAAARQAERLKAVTARLRSLTVPGPLRRSLVAAMADLAPALGAGPAVALANLVAPATECLGRPLGEAVAAAARTARPARPA